MVTSVAQADRAEQANIARLHGAEIPDGFIDRDAGIKLIRTALRQRSGKVWSVTGGRGTAYGWLTIMAPPARRICTHWANNSECPTPERCAAHRYYMSDADSIELAALLGIEHVHEQGQSVPPDDRRLWVVRAQTGESCSYHSRPSWD
jgi:hypothetical protein